MDAQVEKPYSNKEKKIDGCYFFFFFFGLQTLKMGSKILTLRRKHIN